MATLYVRNVPDTLYRQLQKRAESHHVSINDEVLAVLDETIGPDLLREQRREALAKLTEIRHSIHQPADAEDSLDIIREARER
jgi:plasmid stability protein